MTSLFRLCLQLCCWPCTDPFQKCNLWDTVGFCVFPQQLASPPYVESSRWNKGHIKDVCMVCCVWCHKYHYINQIQSILQYLLQLSHSRTWTWLVSLRKFIILRTDHQPTNQPTPWSPPWEANSHSAGREISRLSRSRRCIAVFTRNLYCSLSKANFNQSTLSHPAYLRSILISSSHLYQGLRSGISL
jgi:hypothetical protein